LSDLTYTLVSDGSSDASLMPILTWLLRVNGVRCAVQEQWADFRWLRPPPTGLTARITRAVELFPSELLFIHRDAEREPYHTRRDEIERAVADTTFEEGRQLAWVCVVPVRMQEAWLLFGETAIRRAAGNPSGTVHLGLPDLRRCEDLPNPKRMLHDLILRATELGARRRTRLSVGQMVHRVGEYPSVPISVRHLPRR